MWYKAYHYTQIHTLSLFEHWCTIQSMWVTYKSQLWHWVVNNFKKSNIWHNYVLSPFGRSIEKIQNITSIWNFEMQHVKPKFKYIHRELDWFIFRLQNFLKLRNIKFCEDQNVFESWMFFFFTIPVELSRLLYPLIQRIYACFKVLTFHIVYKLSSKI